MILAIKHYARFMFTYILMTSWAGYGLNRVLRFCIIFEISDKNANFALKI